MLDLLRLTIPFKLSAVHSSGNPISTLDALEQACIGEIKDAIRYTTDGVLMQAKSVYRDAEGKTVISNLTTPFDSLPSSFSGLAFQIVIIKGWPHVTLKASPAKLLQGHNIFGSVSIRQAAMEFFSVLCLAFPDVFKDLDIFLTQATNLDVTYSMRYAAADNPHAIDLGRDLITFFSTLSFGQLKPRGGAFLDTTYWGSVDSQLGGLKAYLKLQEFKRQLKEVTRQAKAGDAAAKRLLVVMKDDVLHQWASHLLRLEASFKKDWLRRHDIPLNVFELMLYQEKLQAEGRCLLRELWQRKTAPLFAACEGQKMKVLDDESVKADIRAAHFRETKSGKISYSYADDVFAFYRELREYGYLTVRKSRFDTDSGERKFRRYVEALNEAGISKATLQTFSLNGQRTNVVPILRFIEMDFSSQHPDWYVEPVSQFYIGHPALSLVA